MIKLIGSEEGKKKDQIGGEKMAELSEKAAYCRDKCPICSRAKRGNKVMRVIASIDRLICPHCKAYERETGKKCTDPID